MQKEYKHFMEKNPLQRKPRLQIKTSVYGESPIRFTTGRGATSLAVAISEDDTYDLILVLQKVIAERHRLKQLKASTQQELPLTQPDDLDELIEAREGEYPGFKDRVFAARRDMTPAEKALVPDASVGMGFGGEVDLTPPEMDMTDEESDAFFEADQLSRTCSHAVTGEGEDQ